MSLINDALKRAKEAQQQTPPSASTPQLRPAEAGPTAEPGRASLLMPVTGAVVAVVLLLFVRHWVQKSGSPGTVQAKTEAASAAPAPAPAAAPTPAIAAAPVVGNHAGTNWQTLTELPPKPAPLKLQAILFSPSRPSAIISGKTVFRGDRIGEFRVAAIGRESATLIGAGKTNVLSLGQ